MPLIRKNVKVKIKQEEQLLLRKPIILRSFTELKVVNILQLLLCDVNQKSLSTLHENVKVYVYNNKKNQTVVRCTIHSKN